jgi:hypothetical protein
MGGRLKAFLRQGSGLDTRDRRDRHQSIERDNGELHKQSPMFNIPDSFWGSA